MYGLQAVADGGKRAADDDAHREVEVAALDLGLEIDRLDPAEGAVERGGVFGSPAEFLKGALSRTRARRRGMRTTTTSPDVEADSNVQEPDALGVR